MLKLTVFVIKRLQRYDAVCGVKFKENFVKIGQMKQAKKVFFEFFFFSFFA